MSREVPHLRALTALAISLVSIIAMLSVVVWVDWRYPVAGDGHYLFATARSLAFDGDLDLGNQYRVLGDRWGLGRDPSGDGWRLPPREIGPALAMLPGLWLHHIGGFDPHWEPAMACLLAAGSLGPTWLLCVRIVATTLPSSARSAAPEALASAACLGFVVPFYAVGRSAYPHALDALACAWLVSTLIEREREASPKPTLYLGLAFSFAVLVRLQNCLWLLWPLTSWIRAAYLRHRNGDPGGDPDRDEPRPSDLDGHSPSVPIRAGVSLAVAGLGVALGLSPQAWLNLAHPGSRAGAIRWQAEFFDLQDLPTDLLRVLAGEHGLVSWTPIAALALVGLGVALRRQPTARRVALVGGALWLLFACVRDVDGGDAFGARRFAGYTGALALGLGWLWARVRPPTPDPLDSPATGARRTRALAWILAGLAMSATVWNLSRVGRAIGGALSLRADR